MFVAQTNGNYMALFSAQRPYRINKKKRYEGHKVSFFIGNLVSKSGRKIDSKVPVLFNVSANRV